MRVMPGLGLRGRSSPPAALVLASAGAHRTVRARGRAPAAAQRGAPLADAAVNRGVARVREARDVVVAEAEAVEVERLALARLQGRQRLEALLVFDPRERALFGAAV